MRLRTSAILALSALSLGACISQPNSASTGSQSPEPINPLVKDYIYYFEHLNEAKTKNEQCLKGDVFKKAGVNMESVGDRQMIAEFPDDIMMLNPENAELLPCFAAWTANNAVEPMSRWREENTEKEALKQKFEKQVIRFKTEWEKKYANEDWNTFYPEALRQESVDSQNRQNRLEALAKREAIDRIFFDKAKPFLNELKTKNIETLTQEIPQSCREGAWNLIPSCKAYYHALKEKLSEKTVSELSDMEKQYNDDGHLSASILSMAYRSALEVSSEKMSAVLMSDYRKLDAEYTQCVKKIRDKIKTIQITYYRGDNPSEYFESYPECVITNQVMEQLNLPADLSEAVNREVWMKQFKQRWKEGEDSQKEQEQLEKSPEFAQTKTIWAQKYAQTPWQNFRSAVEKDYPSMANIFSGTEEEQKQKKIMSMVLEQMFTDKIQPLVDELAKKSIDKLIAEMPASCRGEEAIDWREDIRCDVPFRALSKKFQNQTLEELFTLKDKYEEGHSLAQTAYYLVLNEKQTKQYFELNKDDAEREVAYRECLKKISGVIEKSNVSEMDDGSLYVRQVPGCLAFSSDVSVESLRFRDLIDTLLYKKRFRQASAVKQN